MGEGVTSEQSRGLPRLAIGWLGIALLLYLIWVSANGIAAGTYHAKADGLYKNWTRSGAIDNRASWQFAHDLAQRGLNITPRNPNLLALSARILEAYPYAPEPDWEYYVTLLEQAEAELVLALELRPLWPYDWANLAMLHARRLQFDRQFEHAVRQAILLGPQEDLVQQQLVRAGFMGWRSLNIDMQAAILATFQRGVVHSGAQTAALFAIAEQFGRVELMCDAMLTRGVQAEYLKRHCADAAKS